MYKKGHFLPCGAIVGLDSALWHGYLQAYVLEDGGEDSAESTPAAPATATWRLLWPAIVVTLYATWIALWLLLVVVPAAH